MFTLFLEHILRQQMLTTVLYIKIQNNNKITFKFYILTHKHKWNLRLNGAVGNIQFHPKHRTHVKAIESLEMAWTIYFFLFYYYYYL